MALQDKVRDLTWYNLVEKSKEVFIEVLENVENLWSRIKALEGANVLATYADNTAALAGGLAKGTQYKTATGEVRIVV